MRSLADPVSAAEARALGTRAVAFGIVAVVVILALAAVGLFLALPDADAFNSAVERLFVEADLTTPAEIGLLELLAQTGTETAKVLESYRVVLFVMLVVTALLAGAAATFLALLIAQTRRVGRIERKGIEVSSLVIAREANAVYLNDLELKLTEAAIETLSVLAEARMDDEVLTGAQIEAVISGRDAANCDEAAGATRIKRLRDAMGNQLVSELLVRNIQRKGYTLAVEKSAIRMV